MWKPRKPSIKVISIVMALMLLGINLIPIADATAIIGATFPQQVVQEMTALEQYSQNVTSAMADVQTKINTLNQYTTDLQNLASMPAQEISKVTMPYQQAMYDYQQATGLMNEYQSLYGNLNNIQSGLAQQNMYILNSALSPENYAAAVYQSQSAQAQQNQAQINDMVHSMQALAPTWSAIQQQQAIAPGIGGNVQGFQELSAQMTTLEQQNQQMLADIQQAQLAKNMATATNISAANAINYGEQAGNNYMDQVTASMTSSNAQSKIYAKQADAGIKSQQSCIMNGGSLLTCP